MKLRLSAAMSFYGPHIAAEPEFCDDGEDWQEFVHAQDTLRAILRL